MDTTLWHKFTQHRSLKEELLATGNAELVEVCTLLAWAVGEYIDVLLGFRQGWILGRRPRWKRPQRAWKGT
jgi:predicted NAD-dependent protein-ADP-ribosyltransferase YbiA (DUF1768 family)